MDSESGTLGQCFHFSSSEFGAYPSGMTLGVGQADERHTCGGRWRWHVDVQRFPRWRWHGTCWVQSTGRFTMVLSMGQLTGSGPVFGQLKGAKIGQRCDHCKVKGLQEIAKICQNPKISKDVIQRGCTGGNHLENLQKLRSHRLPTVLKPEKGNRQRI